MKNRSVFLLNDTSVSGHPGCVTVMSVIRDNLEMRGLAISGSWPMGAEPHFGLAAVPGLRQAGAVIVNGEGTLHNTTTRPGARRLLHCMRQVHGATAAPLFLVNATLENLRARDFEALRLCAGIFLRDARSCRYAEENGLSAVHAPDLCFSARPADSPRRPGQLVTDSTLPHMTSALRRWSAAAGARFQPMQPSRLRSMLRWMVHARLHEKSAERYFADIAAAASVITGRFHAVVFALMGETPFLALGSNTSKIHSLLEEALGSRSRLIAPERLVDGGLKVPAYSNEEKRRIRAYRSAAVARANRMFDVIAQAAATSAGQRCS